MAAKKPNDKLSKIDKRIASVAPGKKYSDLTPAEKRKYDTNQARFIAELEKQKKSSVKVSDKGSGKPKYKNVDEAYRQAQLKETKSKTGRAKIKEAVKAVKAESTKSRTAKPSTPKVPVKPRGGRGGAGGGGIDMKDANK